MTAAARDDALARATHTRLARQGLGQLAELAGWLAGGQGCDPPRRPSRVRLLVVAGDHGVAAAGVSEQPEGATARAVAALLDGDAPVAQLAREAGVGLLVHDAAVDRPGGRIDREDALSPEAVAAAVDAGRAVVDAEVDAGTDLLLLGHLGRGGTTVAAVVVAAMTGEEPVAVVGRPAGLDDAIWMRRTAAVRDALHRVHREAAQWDTSRLLAVGGGADLAALVGVLSQAAVRRTPVLLDGAVAAAAALVAERVTPGCSAWWQPADTADSAAHRFALARLGKRPLLSLALTSGSGTGAVLALALLHAAAQLAASPVAASPVDGRAIDGGAADGGAVDGAPGDGAPG